jgi:hypothetical protein
MLTGSGFHHCHSPYTTHAEEEVRSSALRDQQPEFQSGFRI